MLIITKNLASDILDLINSKISKAQIITNQATRNVIITNKIITDNTDNQELVLNIEMYRSEEVAETLQEIQFYDTENNLTLKSTNLTIELPAAKISFNYQIKLVYSQ
jgi:methionine-rich copper-binding protein CopC